MVAFTLLSVAMLWEIARDAMIPKADGSDRPVAIMDGFYRANGRVVVNEVAEEVSEEVGQTLMPYQRGVGVSEIVRLQRGCAQVVYDADGEMVDDGEDMCVI